MDGTENLLIIIFLAQVKLGDFQQTLKFIDIMLSAGIMHIKASPDDTLQLCPKILHLAALM